MREQKSSFFLFRRVIVIIKNLFLPGLVIIISTASWFRTASDASQSFSSFLVFVVFFSIEDRRIECREKMFSRTRELSGDAMTPSVPARNSFSFQFFFFSFFFIGLFLFGVAFPDHFASGWVLTEFVDTLAVCYLLEEKVADCKRTNETTTSSLFRKFPFGYEFLTQIGGSLLSSLVPNVFIRPCVSLGDQHAQLGRCPSIYFVFECHHLFSIQNRQPVS